VLRVRANCGLGVPLGIRARRPHLVSILVESSGSLGLRGVSYNTVETVRGIHLPAFLRLIRFSKVVALMANAWTIFYAVLIVGWQIATLLKEGSWPALPLSYVMSKLGYERGAIYATANVREIESGIIDSLLQVPAIVPLLLASVLLTIFYLWLARTEELYSGN
jgi:hypothetical protein